MSGEAFTLNPGESTVRQVSALWMKSNLNARMGTLIMTNERLVFDLDPVSGGNPIADMLLHMFFKSFAGGVHFDIPLKQISAMKRESFGKNVMMAVKYDGNNEVRFGGLKDFDQWKEIMKAAGVIVY